MKANRTTEEGVIFVTHPPDFSREPGREAFDQEKALLPASYCKAIAGRRDELSEEDAASWKSLEALHNLGSHADAVPTLPHRIERPDAPSKALTYVGSPCSFLPILQNLCVFPRPLVSWNPFTEKPPPDFPLVSQAAASTTPEGGAADARPPSNANPTARDPREVNMVTHAGFPKAAHARATAEVNAEDWAEEQPDRLEAGCVREGGLYIVLVDEQDGELMCGLVLAGALEKEQRRCEWFGRSGKLPLPHAWPNGVAFKRWDSSDLLDSESFLLEVHDSDLTPSGLASRTTSPRLTSEFVRRLRQFATQHELVAAE